MSKIKILKATSYYQDFLDNVYFNRTFDKELSYTMNHRFLMDTCYGWSDFWKTNLESQGDFEVEETVINAEQLQKKWAQERNISYNADNWQQDLFAEQIKAFAPTVLVMQDVYHYAHYLKNLKKIVPSIKLIIGWDGILFHNKDTFESCDIVLSCVEDTCDYYKSYGFKTYFYRFGFETTILDKLKKRDEKYPVSFVGSLVMGEGYHLNRFKSIASIARKTDINIWAASFNYQWKLLSKHQIRRLMDFKFSFVQDVYSVGKRNRGGVFGLEMYQILFDSLITFNSHGDNSPTKAANMRLYEATGVGTCLLTDWKENLSDFFIPDTEVVTYKNYHEAIDKILYLLDNESERKKIALAGQKRTLENYSIRQTMVGITQLIKSHL